MTSTTTAAPMRRITRELAAYAAESDFHALPPVVRAEAARAFLNWMGCVLGGCRDPAVDIADAASVEMGGHAQASVIGRGRRTDIASAALLNCLSSTVNSYDDTHLATVTHPTGPVAASLFAWAEKEAVSGEEFANALALGIEIQCRLSNVLLLAPAQANLGLFITGITGPIGAAVALGRLLRFDEERMCRAIGLAAAQAAGIRGTHGGMAAFFIPANAARSGVCAALLARDGMTCPDHVLEGPKGLVEVFGRGANLDLAVDGLGRDFEMLANAYKPYPAGIVAQPVIDACLEIAAQLPAGAVPADVHLTVHPLAVELTGRRDPKTSVEAQISLFHWAAASLVHRAAGLTQLSLDCIESPPVRSLRARITAKADPAMSRDEARARATLADGRVLEAHIAHARGSRERPMTDAELQAKFDAQAATVLPEAVRRELARSCWNVAELRDVGGDVASIWEQGPANGGAAR